MLKFWFVIDTKANSEWLENNRLVLVELLSCKSWVPE